MSPSSGEGSPALKGMAEAGSHPGEIGKPAAAAKAAGRRRGAKAGRQGAGQPAGQAGWRDITADAYHDDPCPAPSLSSHVAIRVIQQSLMHAWRTHPRCPDRQEPATPPAWDRGSAVHAILFGGKQIRQIDADDFRTAEARRARDEARAAGQIPVLAKDMPGLLAMAGLARDRLLALHQGEYRCEQTAIWRAPPHLGGGWRRARMDSLSKSRRLIVDYKTTEGAVDAPACERRIADMGLQIQAAAYVDAVETLHPELIGRVRFAFQWQEQKPPFALSPPIEMSEAFLSLGRSQWVAAGELWDAALRQRTFPGYSALPYLACPPAWELSRWEERLFADPVIGGRALP